MNDPYLHKSFIFNEKIDREFLYSLYEDDFVYIEEIFKTTLDQLISVVPQVQQAFKDQNMVDLKRVVHKIKPAFGFTGFLETEKECKEFEDACTDGLAVVDVSDRYHLLWTLLTQSTKAIKEQHDRLKEFNSP